ncbi:MAG: PKD domain-containing protein [Candidatus Verstraetearchaeota archaeon]|nr:PKD domain-containing protein [Candidatus Verstraetearchaeota archaeon]
MVVVEDQRQSISAYCPINVNGLEYETEITSTSVNAGEKIELLIKNKGGVNAKFTIDASIGGTQWPGSIELTKGASGTLYIPVPISLETGVHYLNLKFSNNITSEVRSLRYSLNVVGMKLEASLVEKNINAGQYLEISIKNVGGTDLNMDVTGYLISSDGRKFDLPATNFALEKGKTGTLKMKVPESVPTGTYRLYINFADKNTGKTTTFQDEVQIAGFSIAVQLEQYTFKAGDIVNFTIVNTGGTKVVADITVSIDGTSSSQQGTIDVGSSKEFGFKLPDTMETRAYTLTISVKDSISGNTEDFSFEVTISGLAFELELAKTSYATGETVDLVLENSGASPASCSYQAKLTDSKIIFAENSGSANLSPGEKLTIPIQIPDYLKSGNYRIKLVINETTVNQIYILERSLSIKGTDAKITLEPNKSAYFNDEPIIIAVPLSEQLKGELILRVLGHGKGGVEKYYSLVDIQSIGIEEEYVWISAPGVIARYSEITGEVEFFPLPKSEQQHEHFGKSLISVGPDYVWVNRGAELLRFDKSAKSWLVYNSENTNETLPQQFGEIRSLISDQNAVYLLITDFMEYKIAIYDISSNKWTTYNARQISQDVFEIKDIAINGSDLWAVVDIGLAKFDGTSWEILNAPLNNVNKLAISGGVMWISSSNKLARLDGGTWYPIDPPPNVNIISIFIDGSSLWAIFDNNAVGKYDNGWSIYTQSSAYPYNIISKAFQVCPSQNKIWFALRGTGFASLDRTSSSLEQHSYGPSGSAIEHVVSDGQLVFVVSRNSSWGYCLDRFEISSQTWERISEINFTNSMVLFDDKVLLGEPGEPWNNRPGRIVSYDLQTSEITHYETGSGTIILDAKDGYVWISNSSGTYRSQSLESWEKMFDDVFKAIVQSDEGIWAMKSFDDKLYFYNASTGQWGTLTTDDGLLPGTISSIALFEDALWISYGSNKTTRLETSTGVVTHFDPSNSSISNYVDRLVSAGENLWFIHSMGGGIAYYNSTGWGSYSESVISNAVNDIYYKNGVYWFGTENGLIEIGEGIKTLQTLKKTFDTSPTPFQLDPIRDKGTYYLMAVLKNNFDQVLEEKSTTLQVYERATKLSIQTERDYYKENENFIVKIIVENNAPIRLEDNLKVAIGSVELPKVPISISPGESYVQTLNLALNSTTKISAEVTGSSATKTVNIVKPTADVSIDAPTSVGRAPFNVSVFINNTSPIPISIELRLNETRKQMLLQIGESVTVSEQFQIVENSTIDVEISGDVSYKKSVLVEYVERCKVSFNTNEPYREGSVMFNYTAENIGKIDTQFEVTTRIGDQVKNISISLSPGGSKEGYVIFDLPPGKYKFEYSYYMGNGSIDFMVYKAVNLNLTSSVEAKYGKLELDISLENLVPFTFTGNLTWDAGFLKKTEEISLNPMGSTELKFSEALPDIVAGDYTLNISIISNGATVKTLSKIFNVAPPKFEVYLYPLKPSYTVGEELCAVLNVTNIGAINGSVNIECEIPGEYKSSQKITLAPMESQNVTFNIILPDDLIDGFMKLIYRYEGKEYEHVFRYIGYLVSVDVATDKQFYNEGEKATLTFTIKNLNELNIQNMSLVVKFGDYENTTYTSLPPKGSTSLSLTDVPVSNSGRKLFYSVYLVKHSGRSLVIDSLYLPIIKDVVQVWSDKQVYNIGDTIRFYVNSSATGTFKYTVFDTVDTLNITSPNSVYQIDLTAPELPAGTYSFDYSLSNAVADSYKFDLNGYRTKIVKVSFDKSSYIPGETISGNVTVWSNLDMTANFTASLLPPVGKIILDWDVKDIDLKAGENLIGFKLNLTQSSSPGDYAVELSIAKGGYTLSYGTRYVSVEGSVINSIKTDRKSYKQDETALLTVVLYSGTQSVLKIKSGSKLIAESVIDSVGLLTKEFSIPVKEMTTTSVEASLITPYSVSSKQTIFGIINSPPKAIAGPDKTAEVHSEITFDGSKSYDPGDDPLTYAWEFGDGNKASGPIVKHVYDSVGNYTVKLIVTDSKGAYDISTLKVNVVDTTPPKISSISPSDGSVISTTTPTISASFSDNVAIDPSKVVVSLDDVDVTAGSNVTPNGFAYTPPSPLAGGLHKVHVSIIDLYGNKASLTWFFTVSIPAPVSPPAPAPAPEPTPTPPPPVANTTASIIVSIATNASLKVDISSFAPRSSLDSIEITANTSIPSVKIVTEEYTKNPTTLSLPSNVVPISFLKIEINAPPDSISQTIIRFRVAISTITAQNLDPESVQLYRFTNTWKPLATSMVRCDAEYCYFEALSSGFSYFAIAGTPILRESVPPTILSIYPEDGALLTTKRPVIVITYSDNVAVDTSTIRFLLDNVDVTSLSDVNTTALVFTPASDLSEGSHSMYFEVKDKSGNKASKSVQFTVIDNTPPAIYSPQPANGSLVTEANVTISASFHDNVAIDMSSVVVILDGVDVTSRALLTHNAVTYLATLEEGSHTVSLSVKDTSGNQATASWSFTVRLPVDYTNYVAIVIIVLILIVAIYMIMRKK